MVVGVGSSLFMRVWGMGCMGKMWEIEVVEPLVMVWGSRGVYRIREIGGEGKERKRFFLLFIGRFVGVGEQWERM